MIKNIIFAASALMVCSAVSAQNLTHTPQGIDVTINQVKTSIEFYAPEIIRVLKSPENTSYKKESLSVIKKPKKVEFAIDEKADIVTLKSKSTIVTLNLKTGKVAFNDLTGKLLFTEKDYGTQFTPVKDVSRNTFDVRQAFMLDKDEVVYGLGQQQNGKLNQRNQKVYLRNENTRVCIPFVQSIKGYGVFWDNYSPTTYIDNPQETSFDSEIGDCSDYYFLNGGSGDGVVAQMRALTGQAPMMPLWVYGFSQSRERYKTQFELVDVVKKYRKLQVPLDGIVQDWQYWGKDNNWNGMDFDPGTYPRPKSMVDSVHNMNAHLFIVTWPGFAPATKQYQEFKAKNMLINFDTWPPGADTRPYDVYNPTARDIYWNYLNKGVFSMGIDAWWLDSTEPDHINIKDRDFDQPTYSGSFRSVINAFPLEQTTGVYEHQRKTTSAKRVVLLTRSAFAGQQRTGSNTWSGDVGSNWPTLKKQIPAAVSFSLTGLPYWNGDIGGFFAGAFVKGGGAKNPEFQELYTRWMQFAAFTPMMRSHGTDIPREIYQFGNRGDKIFDVQEKFINLRYSLLPYLYSTAWDVTHNSGSIMRALFMDFVKDKQVYDIAGQYMYGKAFMVAPVTEAGTKSQEVYLPAGANWYDFWTGEMIAGGKTVNRATPMEIMPLYVKAGSIIPWGPKVQYAAEKKWDNLELRIYPGADADFTLYEDEGDNYNYEKDQYSTINLHWNDQNKTLLINNRNGSFKGMMQKRNFKIVLVNEANGNGVNASKPTKQVSYTGRAETVKL